MHSSTLTVIIVIVIIIIILNVLRIPLFTVNVRRARSRSRSVNPIRRRSQRKSRSSSRNRQRRGRSRSRHSRREKNLPVKIVCLDLKISPEFHCDGNLVDITTTVTGGIQPYSYKWQDGSTSSGLNGVAFGKDVTLTVTDAKRCKTTIKFSTPQTLECHA